MKHTPTPWRADFGRIATLLMGEEVVIARTLEPENYEANAAFIVKACNEYDKLNGMVDRIHAILDGPVEWDSETIELVSEVLTDNGYVIRDPNDESLFSEREVETGVRD